MDILSDFASNITQIENQIAVEDKRRTDAFNKLAMFLMSFASRTGTRDRLNIFTTSTIEVGAELAGLSFRSIRRNVVSNIPFFPFGFRYAL